MKFNKKSLWVLSMESLILGVLPILLGMYIFAGYGFDFSMPLSYYGHDDIWQLVLTKSVLDNGWFLTNPFLGAPDIAHSHFNNAAQTSSLHSVILKFIGLFSSDAVLVQNSYYLLNFSLISVTGYIAARLLGVHRIFAIAIGIIYAFGSTRLFFHQYAFIPNYFMVPLATVAIVWSAKGVFLAHFSGTFRDLPLYLIRSKRFLLSLLILVLTALSDGYYAFFSLLLLGFSAVIALFWSTKFKLFNALIPLGFAGAMISLVLIMLIPINDYKQNNPEEFKDSFGHEISPFEADIYSTSLKDLVTPTGDHRLEILNKASSRLIEDKLKVRHHEYRGFSSLGTIGAICFILLWLALLAPWSLTLDRQSIEESVVSHNNRLSTVYILAILSAFSFLVATYGGIGPLIAYLYPSIRAYERFSIFIHFFVLSGVALFVSCRLSGKFSSPFVLAPILAAIVFIALLDQIPTERKIQRAIDTPMVAKFLSEREYVGKVEQQLEAGDMLYHYPYAEYMTPNDYYGHGYQGQTRGYLFTKNIRWSVGGSKDSWVDKWHKKEFKLPYKDLLLDMIHYGFKGILIDLNVVKGKELNDLREALDQLGIGSSEIGVIDSMEFRKFPNYGFHLEMDKHFSQPSRLVIDNQTALNYEMLPHYINKNYLMGLLQTNTDSVSAFDFSEFPELLDITRFLADRGFDENLEHSLLKGDVTCASLGLNELPLNAGQVEISVKNNSPLNWRFNAGTHPITLGVHVFNKNNEILAFDNQYRPKAVFRLGSGESKTLTLPFNEMRINDFLNKGNVLVFELLQERNAWFNVNPENQTCRIQL